MKDFIAATAKKLGVDEAVVSKGVGVVLGFLKSKLGDTDFAPLLEKLPGAAALLSEQAGETSSEGGGMLGGLMKAASSVIGGDAGATLGLTGDLQNAGFRLDQLGQFGSSMGELLKEKAGSEVVDQITEKIPELKSMLE